MKIKLFNTSAWRITRVYAMLLAGLAVMMSLVIILVVGVKQYQAQTQKAIGIARALKRSSIATKDDWLWWRVGSSTNSHHTFIKIQVSPQHKKQKLFYSPHTKKFLKNNQLGKTYQLTDNVHYSAKTGFYYHAQSNAPADGKWPAARYDVWVELNGAINLLWLLIRLIILITLLFLVLGTWLIYLLARRLNRPLVQLTEASKRTNRDISKTYQNQLPIPASPQEVHDLSVEFNRLLKSLSDQAQADRQFVSNASHELKTPIAAIRGHVSLIQRRGEQHPEIIPTSLAYIDEESERMQRLIESLLRLSHANQLELTTAVIDVSQLVHQVVQSAQTSMPRTIDVHVQAHVSAETNGDAVRQILNSLMANANKYSPADTTMTVSLTADTKNFTLTVADEGCGIEDSQKSQVFNRFYRAKSVRDQIEGNGLGLAIVQQLVNLAQGQITVEDNQPQGTRFIVTLPRLKPVQQDSEKFSN
ncbi:HAMP domain-containing sensor histidine kinase [Secundilactobacillus odoratitofui]|uniref:HAMP domain-containing sensor histidine kinase n=1 Tax=Secundilactobacillus odoratitofui TaxID=480930 RepID=UPI0007052CD2|nr:HAMP domain-containing sensor histidine kinase [Secundilactobacillus odoratitofui]